MKKTFRKSIACLLAVLMVAFSVPFSALAGQDLAGPTEYGSKLHTVWWDEANPPKTEPDYVGYNSDRLNEHWGDPEGTGGWGFNSTDNFTIDVADVASEVDDLYDEYMPLVSVYVTDYSSNTSKIYGNASKNALADCTVKDPSKLQAGDKIALTFEMGGFDAIYAGQLLCYLNPEYIVPAYWKSGKGGKYTWTKSTAAGGLAANGVVATCQSLGYPNMATPAASVDFENGEIKTAFQSSVLASGVSTYLGRDVRGYGENGFVVLTVSLEVLKDCDLSKVINWLPTDAGTMIAPYMPSKLMEIRPELTDTVKNTNKCTYAFPATYGEGATDESTVYGYIAPVNYYGMTEVASHTHSFEGAVAVNNQDGTHTITCTAAGCDQSAGYQVTSNCTDFTNEVTTQPDCTNAGVTTYTCADCGYTYTENTPAATGHSFTTKASDKLATAATCDAAATYYVQCDNCNEVSKEKTVSVGEANGHDYTTLTTVVNGENGTHKISCAVCGAEKETVACTFEVEHTTLPTTTSTGLDTYTCACGNTYTKVVDKLAHDHTGGVATCQAKAVCDICGEAYGELDADNHTNVVTDAATDSTCQVAGKTEGSHCDACNTVIVAQEDKALAAHDYTVVVAEKVEASYVADGKEAVMGCKWCDATIGGEVIPMLVGKQITVTPAANGTVTANGNVVAEAVTLNIEPNTVVALTAAPAEGFAFVGWSVDGEIVSTDAEYNLVAIADAAVTPVFEEIAKEFTVTFVDFAGNVVSAQTVTDAAAVVIPDGPEMPGYNFVAWSLTAEEIAALTEDTTVTPIYEEIPVQTGYTVIADGCTITINGEDIADKATGLEFNTLVTVKAEGAKAWAVNGSNVAFGDTYTFYLGSDITVVPVFEDVVAAPAVQAVSMNRVEGSHKVAFLATASAPEGVDVVAVGYIYGKNLTEADLTLDKIGQKGAADNAGVVKQAQCAANYEQFSLLYGLTAKQGTASARAYLIYNNANGEQVTIYAPVQSYTY